MTLKVTIKVEYKNSISHFCKFCKLKPPAAITGGLFKAKTLGYIHHQFFSKDNLCNFVIQN